MMKGVASPTEKRTQEVHEDSRHETTFTAIIDPKEKDLSNISTEDEERGAIEEEKLRDGMKLLKVLTFFTREDTTYESEEDEDIHIVYEKLKNIVPTLLVGKEDLSRADILKHTYEYLVQLNCMISDLSTATPITS